MLNRYLLRSGLVSAAILTLGVATFAPTVVRPTVAQEAEETATAKQLQPQEIRAIAQATVVRIEPSVGTAGSGVISGVYQEGGQNVYVVVTAKKLVQDKNVQYDIVTPLPQDGKGLKRQKIRISAARDIEELPGEDIAIVQFRSNRTYQIAKLIESDEPKDCLLPDPQLCNGVYVAGFANPPQGNQNRVFHITQFKKKDKSKTYSDLPPQYNFAGITGGPVLDGSGRVVTLYGKTPTQQKAVGKKRGFGLLRKYPKIRVKLSVAPPLLTISLRDPKPFNFTEEIKESDIDVVTEQPVNRLPVRR